MLFHTPGVKYELGLNKKKKKRLKFHSVKHISGKCV